MRNKRWILFSITIFILVLAPTVVLAEDNSSTVPGNATYTEDAFYFSDQYMWKASLFVAKSDMVNKENSTIDDFYRIGEQSLYINPVSNMNQWYGGKRPSSVSNIFFSKENKINTLVELKNKGGDVNALDPVELVSASGVNMLIDSKVPKVPQLSDGDVYDNGVCPDSELIGDIGKVTNYFNSAVVMDRILNYYAAQQGISAEDLIRHLEFTINGEKRTDWNPAGILPDAINGNPTNQVEWLVVYEPVSIVYVKDTSHPGSYYGYALSATDYAVMQTKHQMDWRYDESRWTAWAGQQPDAWKPNDQRQHVSRLAFLLMGNSVLTNSTWYGLAAGAGVDQNAGIPNNRWTSSNEIRYGGWGMTRWGGKSLLIGSPEDLPDYDYNSNVDIVYACRVFSNIDAVPGQELTVKYEINGETFTDKVMCPKKRDTLSYFKWHTPAVESTTEYDLKISISPYPSGTVNDGGNEYDVVKIVVHPLPENTPPDPKVEDKMPIDFIKNLPVPDSFTTGIAVPESDIPIIKSLREVTAPPYYKDNKVTYEIVTNLAATTLDITNTDTGKIMQLNSGSEGLGILDSYVVNQLDNTITWKITFTPVNLGQNHYTLTPGSPSKGAGAASAFTVDVLEDTHDPVINTVEITSPAGEYADDGVYTEFEESTITIMTNKDVDQIAMTSPQGNCTLTPFTTYSDEEIKGNNQIMDMNNDHVVDQADYELLEAHINGGCKDFTATVPCTHCGAADITQDGDIDQDDLTALKRHLDDQCKLKDCYFHGEQAIRTEEGDQYKWVVRFTPRTDGDIELYFIPKRVALTAEVFTGPSKSLSIKAEEYKNPVIQEAELTPNKDKYLLHSPIVISCVTPLEVDQVSFKTNDYNFVVKAPDSINYDDKEKVWSLTFSPTERGVENFIITAMGEQSTGYLSGEPIAFTPKMVWPTIISVGSVVTAHPHTHSSTSTDADGKTTTTTWTTYTYTITVTASANEDTDYVIMNGSKISSYTTSGTNRIFTQTFDGSSYDGVSAYCNIGAGTYTYKTKQLTHFEKLMEAIPFF